MSWDVVLLVGVAGSIVGVLAASWTRRPTRLALLRETAAGDERARIARELHDSVTQTLFSIAMVADALPRTLERDPDGALGSARELRALALGALAEMRTQLFELRPDALAATSLRTLVQQQAEVLAGRFRVPVDVVADDLALPADVKLALYRIVQEALHNAGRHAHATRVAVRLQRVPGGLLLEVVDDGRGFDPAGPPTGSHGLGIMRERCEQVGATLRVTSTPLRGTSISVAWLGEPVTEPAARPSSPSPTLEPIARGT